MEKSLVHEEFIKACRSGDILCISKCLSLDSSIIEVPDSKHGWTGLYRTIICGNTPASEFLLSNGANSKIKDNKGYSLLYQAVNNSQVPEVTLLLRFAVEMNELQPGKLYLDGNTALHVACSKDSFEIAKILLEQGAEPNIKNSVNGKTPLHIACENTSSALIQLLLQHKANPALKDNFGRSATELAKSDLKSLFHSHYKSNTPDKSPRNSPLLLPFPENVESIPSIPLESFTSLNLSPVSANSKLLFENFEKQCSTYIESEKNEGRHSRAFSFGGNASSLLLWLESVRLEFLHGVLMLGGFDDIEQMVLQMRSNFGITEEMLESIGIDKPGHRKRLLAALDEEVRSARAVRRHRQTQSNPLSCCYLVDQVPSGITSASDLKQWLENVKFPQYYSQFVKAGYDDLEHLLCLMNSKWPINEQVLQDELGIDNQVHRYKLIMKLRNESFGFESLKKNQHRLKGEVFFDRNKEVTACEMCNLM